MSLIARWEVRRLNELLASLSRSEYHELQAVEVVVGAAAHQKVSDNGLELFLSQPEVLAIIARHEPSLALRGMLDRFGIRPDYESE